MRLTDICVHGVLVHCQSAKVQRTEEDRTSEMSGSLCDRKSRHLRKGGMEEEKKKVRNFKLIREIGIVRSWPDHSLGLLYKSNKPESATKALDSVIEYAVVLSAADACVAVPEACVEVEVGVEVEFRHATVDDMLRLLESVTSEH